jgi:hypothetical protein
MGSRKYVSRTELVANVSCGWSMLGWECYKSPGLYHNKTTNLLNGIDSF